jgi:hypothetical protein
MERSNHSHDLYPSCNEVLEAITATCPERITKSEGGQGRSEGCCSILPHLTMVLWGQIRLSKYNMVQSQKSVAKYFCDVFWCLCIWRTDRNDHMGGLCIFHPLLWASSTLMAIYVGKRFEKWTIWKLCRIWGFHSGGFEEHLLLGYDAV